MKKNNLYTLAFTICNFLLVVVIPVVCHAQSIINSPYSRFGLGDIRSSGFTHNISMGGISCALQNDTTAPFFIMYKSKEPLKLLLFFWAFIAFSAFALNIIAPLAGIIADRLIFISSFFFFAFSMVFNG